MRHIAITGIGGFIGLRMAERAKDLGWKVSGLEISEPAAARARQTGATVIVGDINDSEKLAEAFAGADLVFHTAAVVAEDGPRALYERVNNQGTRSVCEAAKLQGVKRLVQLSSIMVYGFNYPENVAEDGPFASDDNIYNETKLSSENIALGFNQPESLGVIVIRPGDVYGGASVPWVLRPLEMIRSGQMLLPTVGGKPGVINHVHVDNLIDGVLLAIEKDACGEAFNITDDLATSTSEFFAYHVQWLGKKTPMALPAGVLYPLLKLAEAILPKLGIELPFKADGVKFMTRQQKISCDKAKQQLGYQPRIELSAGMQQVAQQLQQQDIILEQTHV